MERTFRRGVLIALAGTTLAAAAGPAQARPVSSDRFTDSYSIVEQNFCGQEGLTVGVEGTAEISELINTRGNSQQQYVKYHMSETTVFTNLATGARITQENRISVKDLKVTGNADGTLTAVFHTTGNIVLYDSDGKVLGRDPGQVKWEPLIDDNGTPGERSDDSMISLECIKLTGRTDDFCQAALGGLT